MRVDHLLNPLMRASLLGAALAALALPHPTVARAQTGTLRVVRVSPTADATPLQQISVAFDRPVAGSLDRAVDPATIFHIEPAVRGRLEWRDPVTIRLTPAAPLSPGVRYTVTLSNTFRAMDGTALAEPYTFTLRARGAVLLAGSPVGVRGVMQDHVAPNQRFAIVYSSPVDLPTMSATAYVELSASCAGEKVTRLEAVSQRPLNRDDRGDLREAGGYDRDHATDSLRRVVVLAPRTPMPRGCTAELVLPSELDPQGSRGSTRFPFSTYGDFTYKSIACTGGNTDPCPTGPFTVTFSNPVRGSEVAKRLRIFPQTGFRIRDTISESTAWTLETKLKPRVSYAVIADTAMRDVFGQPLRGNPAIGYKTTGFAPTIVHPYGRLLVERKGFRTLAVQHVNVDTVYATLAPVPDSLVPKVLNRYANRYDSLWSKIFRNAVMTHLPVRDPLDRAMITGVPLDLSSQANSHGSGLVAVRIEGRGSAGAAESAASGVPTIVQVTDLGVHAKVGATEGAVWVTGVSDGSARAGATVVLHDAFGRELASAKTNAQGIARFASLKNLAPPKVNDDDEPVRYNGVEGFVTAQLGDDRAVVAISQWDPDLSPWRFNVYSAWGDSRLPVAGAVFTERGIYRPTERVYAKAIVRNGSLGSLRAPAPGDSIKWLFHDREEGMLREVTVPLSAFGTSDQSVEIPTGAPIGYYSVEVKVKRLGEWRRIASTGYRVAEYRPPEFLIDLKNGDTTLVAGQKLTAKLQARYLFGAPMGRAVVSWQARQRTLSPWEMSIPGYSDWNIGEMANWWEESSNRDDEVFASKTDTLDVRGAGEYIVEVPEARKGLPSSITVEATVTDVNRQAVSAATWATVYPAEFYIAAKPLGETYFWRTGAPQSLAVVAVRPDGKKVPGVRIQGTIVRKEWHRVRREREGVSELVGEWVSDSVGTCAMTSLADTSATCTVTPKEGGVYTVKFTATDRGGHVAVTSLSRWVVGSDWVPWNDETQFKMDVIPDKPRYAVGDTATVLFASPFTNAEAWVTVEREGLIEQRRIRITSGSTTLKFPITEAYAPNAFVSILVARGRSAPPGTLDDGGRPTIRVGYAELRVTPEVKRLTVAVEAESPEYRPADSARVRVRVRDALNRGAKSEVTLWAVDEGVLALTDYKTPDPIDLMYQERGLGMHLASNMTAVAPQVPEGEKGQREPGGGGGASGADVLRSRFKTTAFFLGSVITDANGNGAAVAKLPDNLTTFRLMAVAVTAGDRYGKGESSMLVTRPLLARQALPRFVREGDNFTAGAVINRRDGAAVPVTVRAEATGVALRGSAARTTTLAAFRGAEVRFPFDASRGDSASFRFDVTDNTNADAVKVTIPIRPDHHPVAHTIAGVLTDTASVAFMLPANIDPARSRLTLSVGMSPLTAIRGIYRTMRVYPYDCSEQVVSEAMSLIALYRLQPQELQNTLGVDPRRDIERAVAVLTSRQRSDGGIGYWSPTDWSTSWLSVYAGTVLLDARALGIKVDTLVLSRLSEYLTNQIHQNATVAFSPVANWYSRWQLGLRDKVAAADFLSRFGRPDVAVENELLRTAAQLSFEDRARLAEVVLRRGQTAAARQLMEATWAVVRVEGRRAVIPDSINPPFYFWSAVSPYARVLTATLALDPNHPLVGPLAEAIVQQGRARSAMYYWTTHDMGAAAWALAALERRQRAFGDRSVRVAAGNRVLLDRSSGSGGRDSVITLQGLLTREQDQQALRLTLQSGPGDGAAYYYLTVTEIPATQPVTPEEHGIRVERWYERYDTGKPITSIAEGDLVRVRLRITIPTTRTFVVLDDALPAGLEAVDLSLRTAAAMPGPGIKQPNEQHEEAADQESSEGPDWYGMWDSGWWSAFDHRELRDDRVVYSATYLWPGTYTASYVARATTAGTFVKAPAHAEEMYNPAVYGRSDGGKFVVTPRQQ